MLTPYISRRLFLGHLDIGSNFIAGGSVAPTVENAILAETGDYITTETGDYIVQDLDIADMMTTPLLF